MAYCEINNGLLIKGSMLELWFESHECVSIYDYLLVGHINILYSTCLIVLSTLYVCIKMLQFVYAMIIAALYMLNYIPVFCVKSLQSQKMR